MKKALLVIILILNFRQQSIAQTYVLIPDANFATYLTGIIPAAMNGNSLNITSTLVTVSTLSIIANSLSISNLNGIQYFTSLTTLYCSGNPLTRLPVLPNSLTDLRCILNSLTSLPTLPNSLTYLACYDNSLTSLPPLPNSLTYLDCRYNSLTSLPALPNSLTTLHCSNNSLTNLPALPNSLFLLECGNNNIVCFPVLPNSLTWIYLTPNPYTCLPNYPTMSGSPTLTTTPLCAWDNTASCAFTGLEEIKANNSQVNVYPNPATNVLNIENASNIKIDNVDVFDITGRKILEQKENTSQINIQSLEQGIYQLLITSEGKSYSSKFIKE